MDDTDARGNTSSTASKDTLRTASEDTLRTASEDTLRTASEDTLRATIDRIIPPDEFPGGWEAGAGRYIRRQLAGGLRHLAPMIDAGLAALDAEARATDGCPFAMLPADRQDLLLAAVERGEVSTTWPTGPREFFATLVRLTNEGYYGDPANGGNRDAISWRMIGYDPRLPGEVA